MDILMSNMSNSTAATLFLSDVTKYDVTAMTSTSEYVAVTHNPGMDVTKSAENAERDVIMSTATMHLIESIVLAGMIPPIVVLGVVFNIINMTVFLKQGLGEQVNLCLFTLAVCDTGYLVFLMPWRTYAIAYLVDESLGEYWKARMMFVIGVYMAFTSTSDCMTMLIALERLVAVIWPLKAKTILDLKKTKIFIIVNFLVCFPLNVIFSFKYDVISNVDPVTNITHYHPTVTSFYKNYHTLVDNMFENVNIVIPALSFSVVIIATIVITVRMRSVMAWRQETANVGGGGGGNAEVASSKERRREAGMTRMLTVICTIFTVCLLPYVTSAFCRLVVTEYRPEGLYSNTLFATTAIMHLFICINCSVNFIVYINMSSRYRTTLRALLRLKPEEKKMKKYKDEAGSNLGSSSSNMNTSTTTVASGKF